MTQPDESAFDALEQFQPDDLAGVESVEETAPFGPEEFERVKQVLAQFPPTIEAIIQTRLRDSASGRSLTKARLPEGREPPFSPRLEQLLVNPTFLPPKQRLAPSEWRKLVQGEWTPEPAHRWFIVARFYREYLDWCASEGHNRQDSCYIYQPNQLRGMQIDIERVVVLSWPERYDDAAGLYGQLRQAEIAKYGIERQSNLPVLRSPYDYRY